MGYAVHDDGIAFSDLVQDVPWSPRGIDEVLGDDLEPIDSRPMLQNVGKMRATQADAKSEMIARLLRRRVHDHLLAAAASEAFAGPLNDRSILSFASVAAP